MITMNETYGAGCCQYEMQGLSTDPKPTHVSNGSTFHEIDTAVTYMYDAQNMAWYPQVASSGGGGGVSSWNDLADKPFYEETVTVNEPLNIQWDGNTDGLVCVTVDDRNYYKVSDQVFTDEQLKTMRYYAADGGNWDIDGGWSDRANTNENGTSFYPVLVVVRKPGQVPVDNRQGTFPEAGLYFEQYNWGLTSTVPIEHTKTIVKKIDEKFLPDGDNGGGGASTVYVNIDMDNLTSDHTPQQIASYLEQGFNVVARYDANGMVCVPFSYFGMGAVFSGMVSEYGDLIPITITIYDPGVVEVSRGLIGGQVFIGYKLLLRCDANNKYYDITVDASGNLKATATTEKP